jgi:hypothetical protein
MLIADIVRLLLTAILAALALGGHPLFWQLCVIAVPLGAFGGVFIPALLFPQILQIAFLHKIARIGVSISNSEFCTLSQTGGLTDFLMWLHKRIEEKGCEVGEVYSPGVQGKFLVG